MVVGSVVTILRVSMSNYLAVCGVNRCGLYTT